MKFYICARYGRKEEALSLAETLEDRGHTITSWWIRQTEEEMAAGDEATLQEFARRDLREIHEADALIYLSEEEENTWGRGGRHVEVGYALGAEIPVLVVGPKENIFHYLPYVTHVTDHNHLLASLERIESGTLAGRG